MKTICILSYKRTGSNWLCDTLCGDNTICLYEPFSKDPLSFFYTLFILMKNVYLVDQEILDTYCKIFNYSNFFIDKDSYSKLLTKILQNKPYSINLLKKIQQKAYETGNNLVFKVFPEQIDRDISLKEILNLSDYIVVNYRNNLLDSFVSEQKSILSLRWTSLQKERPYLEKIQWDKKQYDIYVMHTINNIDYFVKNIDKKYVIISYENIHSSNNKIEYIKNTIQNTYSDFIWNFKEKSFFSKENSIRNIEDNFLNKEEFLNSFNLVKKYIYE